MLFQHRVSCFGVIGEIQTDAFSFWRDSKSDHQVDHLQEDERDDARVDDRVKNCVDLKHDLIGVAIDQTTMSLEAEAIDCEDTCGDRTPDTRHSVNPEDVQRIVIAQSWFDERYEDIADDGRASTDHESR